MLSLGILLGTYVLGGLTFVPLLFASLAALIFYTSPVSKPPTNGLKQRVEQSQDQEDEPTLVYRAGWIKVRRTYEPLPSTSDTYMGMITNGYKSWMDSRSRDPRRIKAKENFYGVLKQRILYLYDNEDQTESWAAIELGSMDVSLYPAGSLDGELFVKRVAICLKPKQGQCDEFHQAAIDKTHDLRLETKLPWFLFLRVNSDKEDWYHSLLLASKLLDPDRTKGDAALFDKDDMASLISQIDSTADSIPMRWFNALLGRMFLGTYKTAALENYLTSRIVRKLNRVKTPSMLSQIHVREVDVGKAAPMFSKPMLRDLTADGDAILEMHVAYMGRASVTFSTTATINISNRLKPYTVNLVLAVVLRELEGTLQVKIKRPPSSRIWFGFAKMPRMVLNVEPVVSQRQIKWSLITSPIESRIKEVILESIVLPHMDDAPFFNTSPYEHRGGIFADAMRSMPDLSADPISAAVNGVPVATVPSSDKLVDDAESILTDVSDHKTSDIASSSALSTSEPPRLRTRRSSDGDQTTKPSNASSVSLTKSNTISRDKPKGPAAWLPRRAESPASGPSTPAEGASDDVAKLRDMLKARAIEREKEKAAAAAAKQQGATASEDNLVVDAGTSTGSASMGASPDLQPSQSAPDLTDDATTSLLSASPEAPPALPSRPSFSKGPPPPPRRTHQPAQSADAATATSASALFASWRAKANDKQAIANSVAQARESMRRWGANWRARQMAESAANEELSDEQPKHVPTYYGTSPSDGPADLGRARSVSASSSHAAGAATSPPTAQSGGHFVVPAPVPTTKLSKTNASETLSTSPSSPTSMTKPASYKPATMMSIPGIREQDRKKRVASDHYSAEQAAAAKLSPTASPDNAPQGATGVGSPESISAAIQNEASPATAAEPHKSTEVVDTVEEAVANASVESAPVERTQPADLKNTTVLPSVPELPTAAETEETKRTATPIAVPPPLPSRNPNGIAASAEAEVQKVVVPPLLPPRAEETKRPASPPRPAWIRDKAEEKADDEPDEIGWGFD